jgi:hypothetical protein
MKFLYATNRLQFHARPPFLPGDAGSADLVTYQCRQTIITFMAGRPRKQLHRTSCNKSGAGLGSARHLRAVASFVMYVHASREPPFP